MAKAEAFIAPTPLWTRTAGHGSHFPPRGRKLDRPSDGPCAYERETHSAVHKLFFVPSEEFFDEAAGIVRKDANELIVAGLFRPISAEPHDRRMLTAELLESPIAIFFLVERFDLKILTHC